MRLAIAGFNLESVTFLPNPTTLNDFEVLAKRGQDLLDSFSGTNTVPGGFIEECNAHKIEILPLVYSEAGAAASATDEAFDHYLSEISEGILEEKIALDGICWASMGLSLPTAVKLTLILYPSFAKKLEIQYPLGFLLICTEI